MNELYNQVIDFKKKLDNEKTIKDLKMSYIEIYQDEELMKQIKDYKENKNYLEEEKINKNPKYIKMKHLEARLGYMILEINKRLKEIIKDEDNK